MLYPFTFTVDCQIQADSYEEAQKVAEAYLEADFLKEFMDIPVCLDSVEIVSSAVDDVADWGEGEEPWDEHGCIIHR